MFTLLVPDRLGPRFKPLRPLNDFIFPLRKYRAEPNIYLRSHRVVENLIYYESNYIFLAIFIFCVMAARLDIELVQYGVTLVFVYIITNMTLWMATDFWGPYSTSRLLFMGAVLFWAPALTEFCLTLELTIGLIILHASHRVP